MVNNVKGLVKHVDGGNVFVKNGVGFNYTGGAKSVENGKWYAVSKGALNWNFTGKLSCIDGKSVPLKKALLYKKA